MNKLLVPTLLAASLSVLSTRAHAAPPDPTPAAAATTPADSVADIRETEAALARLRGERTKLQEAQQKIERDLADRRERVDELEAEIARRRARVAEIEAQLGESAPAGD